ncbi:MAG: hypothetical protein ACRD29_02015 [Acidimicrobiales bacterium]
MAVDEAARMRLFEKARDTWGEEEAITLISSLPRDPDRLVTKDHLDGRIFELGARISQLETTLTTRMLTIIVTTNATMVGLVLAAVKPG